MSAYIILYSVGIFLSTNNYKYKYVKLSIELFNLFMSGSEVRLNMNVKRPTSYKSRRRVCAKIYSITNTITKPVRIVTINFNHYYS